jgi:hypothetical protein
VLIEFVACLVPFNAKHFIYQETQILKGLTITFTVTWYVCKTWPITFRMERNRLRILENRVLKKLFGHKREPVIGGCRKLHGEELNCFNWAP